MSTSGTSQFSGTELDDDRDTVVQSLARNKYRAEDSAGNVVLRGTQEMFKLKEGFPCTDADGGHVGNISGQLSVRDTYDIGIDDASDVPKEAVVAAAMVLGAIEEN
jgi:uncharacterized protein YxjI